jgi:hypothetical protein
MVEDETDVLSLNKRHFEEQGYDVDAARTLGEARVKLRERPPDLVLLDAAVQVYGGHVTEGHIPGTGITITQASPGVLRLTFGMDIPHGMAWSGTITLLKFSAQVTGHTMLYLSES